MNLPHGLPWCWGVGLLAASNVLAARYGDLQVSTTSTRTEQWSHGYNEHTFVVQNGSPTTAHRLTIEIPSSPYSSYGIYRIARTVDVPPGATVQVSLPQPPMELSGPNDAVLTIDGTRQRNELDVASLATSHTTYNPKASVLVSRSFATDALRLRTDALVGTNTGTRPRRSGSDGPAYTRAEVDPPRWSASWLNYTRFDAVLLGAAEWHALPDAARNALARFTAAGGTLVLVGPEPTADPLPSFFPRGTEQDRQCGLGRILRVTESDPARWPDSLVRDVVFPVTQNASDWIDLRDNRGRVFKVVEGLRIPVRGIYLLLVVFALLIGPVTVVLLARRNRRIWLYWIAPTASLATCAVIFIHALVTEGTKPTVRTDSVVLLDQESRLAVALATTGYYCPMTPAGGLSFGAETEVTPLTGSHADGRRAIDWTTRQHFETGWILSRIPSLFVLRSATTRHERLDVTVAADGAVSVVNGLGAPIRRLRLADRQGRRHAAETVPAGDSAVLRLESAAAPAADVDLATYARGLFFEWSTTNRLAVTVGGYLPTPPPGHYVAVLDGAPFADDALPGPARRTATTLVCGRLAPSR